MGGALSYLAVKNFPANLHHWLGFLLVWLMLRSIMGFVHLAKHLNISRVLEVIGQPLPTLSTLDKLF